MKWYLDSRFGTSIASEQRIRKSLARVSPVYQQQCQARTERQTNPHPYLAEYYGHKLHIDQNEKLAMYGVTHVCAIDGFSKYIPAFSCMPVKNNVVIYDDIFRYFYIIICIFKLTTVCNCISIAICWVSQVYVHFILQSLMMIEDHPDSIDNFSSYKCYICKL